MQKLTELEIDSQVERALPLFYRKLLVQIGFGEWGDIELYHPNDIDELYEYKFDDENLLYKKYFPIGCNNLTQELWIIDLTLDKVASIFHETHEDEWPEESWKTYESWLEDHIPKNAGLN